MLRPQDREQPRRITAHKPIISSVYALCVALVTRAARPPVASRRPRDLGTHRPGRPRSPLLRPSHRKPQRNPLHVNAEEVPKEQYRSGPATGPLASRLGRHSLNRGRFRPIGQHGVGPTVSPCRGASRLLHLGRSRQERDHPRRRAKSRCCSTSADRSSRAGRHRSRSRSSPAATRASASVNPLSSTRRTSARACPARCHGVGKSCRSVNRLGRIHTRGR